MKEIQERERGGERARERERERESGEGREEERKEEKLGITKRIFIYLKNLWYKR